MSLNAKLIVTAAALVTIASAAIASHYLYTPPPTPEREPINILAVRLFLTCMVTEDQSTGIKQLVLENNTGRSIQSRWPIFYQQNFDRHEERARVELEQFLEVGERVRLPILNTDIRTGKCNAWTVLPKQPVVPESINARTASRESMFHLQLPDATFA